MTQRRIRITNTKDGSMFPFLDYELSRAVRSGNIVHPQGQTGISLDGKGFVGIGDPAEQANNAMVCVRAFLGELGARMEDICKITTYVTDPSYRDLVYPVLADHLGDISPCSTGIVVKALALPHIDFEIDVYAVIPEDRA